MKRGREEGEPESLDMANCLMLLSRVGQSYNSHPSDRVFECKTCNRQFSSFQALGGHRASHKKPRIFAGGLGQFPSSPAKPKTHECSICGLEFHIGQALGGHMRRHRGAITTEGLAAPKVPVLKKSNSSKRVMCLDLDLNLTPLENDLKLQYLNRIAPVVDCHM